MSRWKVALQIGPTTLKLLVQDPEAVLLKARLPMDPDHPRALLTLLEGLALWGGAPLDAATSVVGPSPRISAGALFGGPWPHDSALVHFVDVAGPARRRRPLSGVGDFQQLRLVARRGEP
jgi:hypothetical protein